MSRKLGCGLSLAALAWAPFAWAQGDVSPGQAADNDGDIIVTATKRSQNLQDVPIAVSAFSSEQLQKSGINDTRELMTLAPSLNLTSTTSDSAGVVIRLRGVGSEAINPGLESSVATFVDGVYRSRSNLSLTDIPGIERIEVLRGPQGTLFGKNTSAGLINVITFAPKFEPSFDAAVSYGNYDLVRLNAGGGGTLVQGVAAFRLDAAYQRRDGFLRDFASGQRYRNRNRVTLRGQLLLTPADDVDIRLIADYGHRRETGPDTYSPIVNDPVYVGIFRAMGFGSHIGRQDLTITTTQDRASVEETDQWGLSGELNWDVGGAKLTSITGYRHWRNDQAREVDYAEADLVYIPFKAAAQAFDTFTQELRLDGSAGPVDWMVGGFYSHEKAFGRYGYRAGRDLEPFLDRLFGPATGRANPISFYTGLPVGASYPEGSGVGRDDFRQTSRSLSVFTHNVWHVTDRLDLIGGLRFTREAKRVDVDIVDTLNPGCQALIAAGRAAPGATPISGIQCLQLFDARYDGSYTARKVEKEWSGIATISYDFSDALHGYATYSRGYKAGGFVLDRAGFRPIALKSPDAADLAFDPELATNHEAGLKFRSPGGGVTVNGAVFYTRFTDYQLSYNTGAALITTNIPRVTAKGFELELGARPAPGWQLAAGVTYASSRYGAIPPGPPANVAAIAGQQLANAPKWVVTGSVGWDDLVAGGSLRAFVQLDGRYQSDVLTERLLRPTSGQRGYALFNARLGVGTPDERWTLELWARNLADQRTIGASIPATFQGATLVGAQGEPRTYGLTVRTKLR